MDSSDLLSLLRTELRDLAEPYLWADEELISFMDDAQKMFCRKTDGIPDDSTAEVTQIDVVPDDDRLDLHPSILKIRGALRTDTGRPVDIVNKEDMPGRGWFFDGRTGPLKALVIGATAHQARVYPTANETLTIELTVFRLPIYDIDDTDQPFEIDVEHHRHLSMWCKHLAYGKQDAETFDKTKAAQFEQEFLNYCDQVKEEERRKRHKTRVVRYGGL